MRGKTSSRFFAGACSGALFHLLLGLGLAEAQTELLLTADGLLGSSIRTESESVAGEIRELVLDAVEGSIHLVVVELPGAERRTVAVPWSYLTVRSDGSVRLRASESELLLAPAYPLRSSGMSGRRAPEIEVSEPASFAPTEDARVTFDPGRIVSYSGVVVGTMTAPLEGVVDFVVAVVDVGGEEIHAHLGPQAYLDRLACDVEPGQSVVLEGSPSDADGTTVVAVSKIFIRERSCELRAAEGSPRFRTTR